MFAPTSQIELATFQLFGAWKYSLSYREAVCLFYVAIFGQSLEQTLQYEQKCNKSRKVPHIVECCITYLRESSLHEEGLFRCGFDCYIFFIALVCVHMWCWRRWTGINGSTLLFPGVRWWMKEGWHHGVMCRGLGRCVKFLSLFWHCRFGHMKRIRAIYLPTAKRNNSRHVFLFSERRENYCHLSK